MKKKYIYILSLLAGIILSISSCSKEADPTFDFTDPRDGFAPADDATDEISVLRRNFYNETGSFLLFNDTLRHDYIGKDLNGEDRYFTELLDIKYEVHQCRDIPEAIHIATSFRETTAILLVSRWQHI